VNGHGGEIGGIMLDFRRVFFCIVSLLIVYATVYVLYLLDASYINVGLNPTLLPKQKGG
jgi:hypothetical protein